MRSSDPRSDPVNCRFVSDSAGYASSVNGIPASRMAAPRVVRARLAGRSRRGRTSDLPEGVPKNPEVPVLRQRLGLAIPADLALLQPLLEPVADLGDGGPLVGVRFRHRAVVRGDESTAVE